MRVGKMYSYVFFNAAMVTNLGIRHYPRIALVSVGPLQHSVYPFQIEDDDSAQKMLDAVGMKYWHRLEGDSYIAMVSVPDANGEGMVEIMQAPISVASVNENYHEQIDYAPQSAIDRVFPEAKLREKIEWSEMSAQELMDGALKRLHGMAETNAKFGMRDDGQLQRMIKLAEIMEPIVKRMDANPTTDPESKAIIETLAKGGTIEPGTKLPRELLYDNGLLAQASDKGVEINAGIYEGSDVRYVAMDATDFRKVAISTPQGLKPMDFVRVFHDAPAEWHPREEAWPKDLLGYWLFKTAALGENVKLANTVGFMSVTNLAVVVKDADAIAPAGSMAIPAFIWQQMNPGKELPKTMDENEGLSYNSTHAVAPDVANEPVLTRTLN